MAIAALALYAAWAMLAFGWRSAVQQRRTGDSGFRGISGAPGSIEWSAGMLFVLAIGAGIAAPLVALAGALEPVGALDHRWVAVLGVVVAGLGIVGTVAAQIGMGDSWRVGVDAGERTRLVSDGPFAWARNPIFTMMLVTAAGLMLMVPNLIALGGLAGLVVGIELQVRFIEEPYLSRVHGADYDGYAARVGRFLPGVGRLNPRG